MILVMDAQETQILGQVLTGLGTVLLSGAFGFLTYLVKKHMSSIVAWIDSYIGAKNFDKIVIFIKASIAEAEKDGIADDLTGEAKHNKVVQEVETKFSSILKGLGIDEPALEKLVEGYWASMEDTLTTAYINTKETEAQKKLDEVNKAKAEADAAKAEADAEQKKVTETQTKLNSALAAVQSAASGTTTDTTDTTPTTITSGTVNATNATVTSGNKAATGDAAVKATATDSNSTTDAGSTTK